MTSDGKRQNPLNKAQSPFRRPNSLKKSLFSRELELEHGTWNIEHGTGTWSMEREKCTQSVPMISVPSRAVVFQIIFSKCNFESILTAILESAFILSSPSSSSASASSSIENQFSFSPTTTRRRRSANKGKAGKYYLINKSTTSTHCTKRSNKYLTNITQILGP